MTIKVGSFTEVVYILLQAHLRCHQFQIQRHQRRNCVSMVFPSVKHVSHRIGSDRLALACVRLHHRSDG